MINDGTMRERGAQCYERYLSGDENALSEIVSIYSDNLLYFINGYIGNVTESEDILSDTFLMLIIKKPRFRGESSFKAYLYTIARNKSFDYLRRRAKHTTDEIPDETILAADEEELCEAVFRDERNMKLHAAMDKLNEQYRRILYLVYFESLSVAEAAKVLKIGKKQAENLHTRAKAALRVILTADGFDF